MLMYHQRKRKKDKTKI